MKKIFTVLFCTVIVASAFAQTRRPDWDDRNSNNNRYGRSNDNKRNHDRDNARNNNNGVYQNNSYRIAQRDREIQRISSQYDYRIQQVSYDRSLSRRQKKNTVKALEAEKAQQINRVYLQYNNSNVYNNRNNRDNDYGRYNR